MACPHCGSWSVKADRSLAASRRAGRPSPGRRLKVPWWGWLVALLAFSAGLASLQRPINLPAPMGPSSPEALSWL